MINLASDEARRRAAEESMRIQVAFEQSLAKRLASELARFGEASHDGYLRSEVQGLDLPWIEHTERLRGVLLPAIEQEIYYFGGRAIERLILTGVFSKQPSSSRAAFDEAARYHVTNYGGKEVVNVSQTSRKVVNNAVAEGVKTGQTREQIARNIWDNNAGEIGMKRARIIATTESHNAAMSGDFYAMESTGIPFKKRWLTFIDKRTRDAHKDADDQVRQSSLPFEVGGETLMRPGDPTASAHNVINCRCQMVYDFD